MGEAFGEACAVNLAHPGGRGRAYGIGDLTAGGIRAR